MLSGLFGLDHRRVVEALVHLMQLIRNQGQALLPLFEQRAPPCANLATYTHPCQPDKDYQPMKSIKSRLSAIYRW